MKNYSKNLYQLQISDLRLWVHLGCSEQEKHHPQQVSVNVYFKFKIPPEAIKTDNLQQTICYKEVIEAIKLNCVSRCFNLIEFLTQEIYICIRNILDKNKNLVDIDIIVKKISPPIPDVFGGVIFSCSEQN